MKNKEIIKAWKNPEFRDSMGASKSIPENPAGESPLSDQELSGVFGGVEELQEGEAIRTAAGATLGCCTYWKVCDGLNTNWLWTYGCCPKTL